MDLALFIPFLLVSVVVHEVAHAWQALREGDRTAEAAGRITLNPLPHLDLWGSFLIPALLFVGGGVMFGWAKPVPVDPRNFRHHPWSDIRVSLAGIVANLALAALFTLMAAGAAWLGGALPAWRSVAELIRGGLYYGIFINLILAVFNLIPIPPLDGSHVVFHMLPTRLRPAYRRLGGVGLIVLMGLVFFLPNLLGLLLTPVTYLMGFADTFIRSWL